ncbi:MAG: hypothetical protein M1824_001308 [Vezdaea acicularis]|nr:MAG: hypothetical protein M1824_001308 [Vezdaea acicularis]
MNLVRSPRAASQEERSHLWQPTPVRPLRADFMDSFTERSNFEATRMGNAPNRLDNVQEWVTAQQLFDLHNQAQLLRAIPSPPGHAQAQESRANPDHTFDSFLDPTDMIAMKDKKSKWMKVKAILKPKKASDKSKSTKTPKRLKKGRFYSSKNGRCDSANDVLLHQGTLK